MISALCLFFLPLGTHSAKKWLWTTQNWLFYVPPKALSSHDQIFQKHATISIKLLRQRTSFVVSLKQPFSRLMFSLRLQRWFMSCYNLIQVFWSTAIVFLNHLFIPKTWASAHILSDYVESSENRTETAIKFVILAFHIGKGWGIIAESGSKFNDAHLSDNPRRKLY